MATTKKRTRTGARSKSTASRKKKVSVGRRIEQELPATLRQFTSRVTRSLSRLERDVSTKQAKYRRRAASMLREASRALGRLESNGEVGWKRLDAQAKRRASALLGRLEKAAGSAHGRGTRAVRKAARKTTRRAQRVIRRAASAVAP